jgi:hypothetical protein
MTVRKSGGRPCQTAARSHLRHPWADGKTTYCSTRRQADPAPGWTRSHLPSGSLSPVGSKGQKPRKSSHSQHLPKAGTRPDNELLMHEEHEAILDTMGLGGAGKGTKTLVWVVGALLLIGAIVGLVILTVALS